MPLPLSAAQLRQTSKAVVDCIDRLLGEYTDVGVAAELNRLGLRSGTGCSFTALMVWKIRRKYGLKTRYDRLREERMLTQEEMATRLGVCPYTIRRWRAFGLLRTHAYNDKNQYLYEPMAEDAPVKRQGQKRLERPHAHFVSDLTDEVQHEA